MEKREQSIVLYCGPWPWHTPWTPLNGPIKILRRWNGRGRPWIYGGGNFKNPRNLRTLQEGNYQYSTRKLNKPQELSDKSTSDRRTHFVLHKYEQLPALEWTANTAHNSAQQKLKNQISKQKGLFEKSKKLSILQNHHPEFFEQLEKLPTFHESLLSAYKRNKSMKKTSWNHHLNLLKKRNTKSNRLLRKKIYPSRLTERSHYWRI